MLKVAIVDDEVWACRLVQKLIDWDNLELELAFIENNGESALDRILTDEPDIVITDIRMPVMDGISLLENMAKLEKKPEIIILSGYPDFNYAVEVMKLGASNYLLKPVEKVELNNTLIKIKAKIIRDRLFEDTQVQIKKKFDDNIDSLRAFFFSKTTSRDIIDEHALSITIGNNMLFGKYSNYIVVVAKIISNERNTIAIKADLIKLKIDDIFGLRGNELKFESYPFRYENKCLYLLNYADELKKDIDEIIRANYSRFSITLAGSKYKAIFGVSSNYNDKYKTQAHYREAMAALSGYLVKQTEKVYYYENDSTHDNIKDVLTDEHVKSILIFAETLNVQGLISELGQVYADLEKSMGRSPELAYEVTYRIADLVFETVDSMLQLAGLGDEMKTFSLSVENLGQLSDIKCFCTGFFAELLVRLQAKRHENSRSLIGKAKDYILKNYDKKISLSDVAEILYINPKYFSNLFKKETGHNFVEFVNSVRLDVAKSMLSENKYSIGQIANKVGFSDLRHFSKLFKDYCGVTPKDYKQYHL